MVLVGGGQETDVAVAKVAKVAKKVDKGPAAEVTDAAVSNSLLPNSLSDMHTRQHPPIRMQHHPECEQTHPPTQKKPQKKTQKKGILLQCHYYWREASAASSPLLPLVAGGALWAVRERGGGGECKGGANEGLSQV